MRVTSRAPCRADLAGGTLDIWPLGLLHPGAVTVNAAVAVGVSLEVDDAAAPGQLEVAGPAGGWRPVRTDDGASLTSVVVAHLRPAAGVRVRALEQPPVGSGLGASSTFTVALARALLELAGESLDERRLVAVLRDLEARVLQAPTGAQDHWAAVRGGMLALWPAPGEDRIETLDVDPTWLTDRLTLFYTGLVHHSGMVNWHVIRRRLEGDATTSEALDDIADAAGSCREALLAGREDEVGRAIAAEWRARRRLAPEVCPPELDELAAAAAAAGAIAVKACGAGGGGSLLAWHRAGAREAVAASLLRRAPTGKVFPPGAATDGCRVSTRGSAAADPP